MIDTLTPKQTLMIWSLLFQGGKALQSRISPEPGPKDRAAFGKLVSVSKHGRSNVLELTDSGWGWATQHLSEELPADFAVLRNVLIRLDAHFKTTNEILAEFVGPAAPLPDLPAPKARAKKTVPIPPKAPKTPSDRSLKTRIKQAYEAVTGVKHGVRAGLSDLRAQLADIDRSTLDGALIRLHEKDDKMQLMRFDNPKEITPAVKAAELMFKGEPVHLLWINK